MKLPLQQLAMQVKICGSRPKVGKNYCA